jgi:hypothetical protein
MVARVPWRPVRPPGRKEVVAMMHEGGWWWMGGGSFVFAVVLVLTVWVLVRLDRDAHHDRR